VPDDLPLAPARRPLSAPDPPRTFWDRSVAGWHAVWVGVLLVVAAVLALGVFTPGERAAGLAAVAGMLLAYLLLGARLVGRERDALAAGHLALVLAGLLVVQSVAGLPLVAPALFVLFPQLWTTFGRAAAVAATVAVPVVLGVGRCAEVGWEAAAVRSVAVESLAQSAVAVLLGLWITGMVRESTGRAELLDQLTAARADLAAAEHARGVLAERERVAREIHDTLAQGFTSVVTLAQAADAALETVLAAGPSPGVQRARARLALMESTARANLAEARAIVEALRPADLEGADDAAGLPGHRLAAALDRVARRFTAETGVAAEVTGADRLPPLAPQSEVVLVRAAQEGLSNVRRHARATRVVLHLAAADGEVVLDVVDDGAGPGPAPAGSGGYGLPAMASRLREVGGRVALGPGPHGRGSVLTVRVPLVGERPA
jgi:signal transduction histidine kinase